MLQRIMNDIKVLKCKKVIKLRKCVFQMKSYLWIYYKLVFEIAHVCSASPSHLSERMTSDVNTRQKLITCRNFVGATIIQESL